MRIIQRNVLREYWPRIWAARNRGSGPSESGIPPEKSIYSDSGWDTSEPNVRLETCSVFHSKHFCKHISLPSVNVPNNDQNHENAKSEVKRSAFQSIALLHSQIVFRHCSKKACARICKCGSLTIPYCSFDLMALIRGF